MNGKRILWLGHGELDSQFRQAFTERGAEVQTTTLAGAIASPEVHVADAIVIAEATDGPPVEKRLEKIRRLTSPRRIPILMVLPTPDANEALLKADLTDFVVPPYGAPEVSARLEKLLRIAQAEREAAVDRLRIGSLELDFEECVVYANGERIPFTRSEFKILACLAMKPGRVCLRKDLLSAITEGTAAIGSRNVDVHLGSIRKKLGPHPLQITGVRGIGYKLEESAIDDKNK